MMIAVVMHYLEPFRWIFGACGLIVGYRRVDYLLAVTLEEANLVAQPTNVDSFSFS